MTDSMNFGPDWIRNLSSDGSTGNAGGGTGGGTRYQLAEYRYGREEMLALFDKNSKPPVNLTNFKCLYSDIGLLPLALLPTSEEERGWQGRVAALSVGPPVRGGRGGSMERGGGRGRGRGGGVYQYTRVVPAYEGGGGGGWGNNGDQSDWSPRKEYNPRTMSMDNWRRTRNNEEDDGWRNVGQTRTGIHDKWCRSTSWRGEGDSEERTGPPERGGRTSWSEQMNRGQPARRSWDNEDHLPEWATENPTEGGGSFDDKGAFHGSDDEQLEGRPPNRRETPALQKSTSQQHISSKSHHPPLASSKSTMSLVKSEDSTKRRDGPPKIPDEDNRANEEIHMIVERKKSVPNIPEKIDKEVVFQERAKSEGPPKCKPNEKQPELIVNGPMQDTFRHEDSDFEKLQEDFVLKLVVDEELPKQTPNNFDIGNMPVPPNLVAQQIPDKWFYQDPQGQMQGPFTNLEMAEWYKAGYFSNQLKVRRHYDERFFLLGELISMCGGVNPFQAGVRFPTLKNDVTKMPEPDIAQFQYLSQMNAYKEAQARILAEPWSALTLQQQETAAQRLIMQQQVPQDLQYIQQPPVANPLMHMINQMQQANKLPGQGLVDKQPPNIPGTIDPHLHMHMSNILSMQSRIPAGSMTNNLPTGMAGNLTGSMPPENLSTSMPSLQSAAMNSSGMTLSGMQGSIPVSIGGSINMPRPTSHGSVDQVNSVQDNDPISSLLKQLQQQKQHDWQQNQYGISTSSAPPPQWQTQNEVPLTMWDLQQNNTGPASPAKIQPEPDDSQSQQHQNGKVEKELRMKEEALAKELKRKKEQEEKQLKKEAEEKRKQEQRRIECEKRVAEEKKRKEEERVKKELEKVKREAEEKRMRELEEKRKLKDQRKAEEEAKKRAEEHRKTEEERIRQELKKAEAKRQAEDKKLQQEQIRIAKVAPWSQSNSTLGMSLTEIQKAEKERKAQETALQVQRLQEKEMHQQQQQEKNTGIHLNWAKKPVEPRKVKSLAEIQAEEQEQLAKQAAESRLQKEKEVVPVANNTSSIWNNQNLNWTNPSANNHQWSTTSGFWDDSSSKNLINKPSSVTKSNSTNTFNTSSTKQQQLVQAQKHQTKSKTKKEEPPARSNHNNNNRPATDDFTNWCYKTLSNISTNVDVPTFITFLRDIESAFDVREYCKEYLGESNATHQFASNFLEKRRSFKPKNNAHKDDMCSPAPAITPSLQHSTEFQEVKGKKQKNKKSKMLKVDSRILGFNVTSAPDRINVGDRDYGDNS